VIVGHAHHARLIDAPSIALRTGAQLPGSASTARVGRAIGGRQILVLDTANFIERELAGLRPDIAIRRS
jgi:hypothetical protein